MESVNFEAYVTQFLVFDFDGVLADSETLANEVLARVVSELGVATTLEESMRLYMGKRFQDVMIAIETVLGHPLPHGFAESFQRRTLDRFRQDLQLVKGARAFLDAFKDVPKCIASSSSPDRLKFCLEVLNLDRLFGENIFSASQVVHGKPHPDIFLYAAQRMGMEATRGIVIEDSVGGVTAGLAAGMTVIGLTAASHIRDGHAERLAKAGAHYVASTFEEVEPIVRALLAP